MQRTGGWKGKDRRLQWKMCPDKSNIWAKFEDGESVKYLGKTFPGAGSPKCKALGLEPARSVGGTARSHDGPSEPLVSQRENKRSRV